MQSLIALKPYILLVFAIATGLFVRTVGQWILDWAKAPSEMAKSRNRKDHIRAALKSTIGNAKQYCEQITGYLEGVPIAVESLDEKLKVAAFEARILTLPTFNIDLAVLEHYAGDIYEVFSEEVASAIHTARLELAHVSRRVDAMVFAFGLVPDRKLTPELCESAVGTRIVLGSALKWCGTSLERLDADKTAEKALPSTMKRIFLALLAVVGLVLLFLCVARLPDSKDATKPELLQPADSLKSQPVVEP